MHIIINNTLLRLVTLAPLLILFSLSCDNTEDCCVIIDNDVQIHYKNALGQNLINSTEAFQASNIKIFFKKGDAYEYVYNSNFDNPNMHRLDTDPNDNLILTVFPSDIYQGNFSTTLIQLNKNVVDTLYCEFLLDDGNQICKNAWLNGVVMKNRFIEVTK